MNVDLRLLSTISTRNGYDRFRQVAHNGADSLLGLGVHRVSLGHEVVIIRVRHRCPLEQDVVVLHHADHNVVVGARVEQVRWSHRQWPENVRADRHRYIVTIHSVFWLVHDDFPHELDYEL